MIPIYNLSWCSSIIRRGRGKGEQLEWVLNQHRVSWTFCPGTSLSAARGGIIQRTQGFVLRSSACPSSAPITRAFHFPALHRLLGTGTNVSLCVTAMPCVPAVVVHLCLCPAASSQPRGAAPVFGVVHRHRGTIPASSPGWGQAARRDSLLSLYEQKVGCNPLHMNCKVIKNLTDVLDTEGWYFAKLGALVCCNKLQ